MNPTERFSSRVEDYVRYRPSYPNSVIGLLTRECGLSAQSRIADIGSGTGLLSRLFLDLGCEVSGVEPNREMRQAGEQILDGNPHFHSIDGRAEATTLPAASFDFVTAGTAFHWFDPEPTRREFRRILKPGGYIVLVWNERPRMPGFMAGYEQLVARYARVHAPGRSPDGKAWSVAKFPNPQQLDLAALRGRFLSSSYAPLPGAPEYAALLEDLAALFREHESRGHVTMQYETEMYFGRLED